MSDKLSLLREEVERFMEKAEEEEDSKFDAEVKACLEYQTQQIHMLREHIMEYEDNELNLPCKPVGELFGIAFCYDEDMDDRILIAIMMLAHFAQIVAVREHEGSLDIYTMVPVDLDGDLFIGCDVWKVTQHIFINGVWEQLEGFAKCVVDEEDAEDLMKKVTALIQSKS